MDDFEKSLAKQLEDHEFRAAWEEIQPEVAIAQALIDARERSGITQKKLSEVTGIAQGDISKLERGSANPSIRTLQRLAKGMGMKLKIEFLPAKPDKKTAWGTLAQIFSGINLTDEEIDKDREERLGKL